MQRGNPASPERGGASVMGGERSAFSATHRRRISKEATMISRTALIQTVAAETGEDPETVARIVDAAGRTFLAAFVGCNEIPYPARGAALRTAEAFVFDNTAAAYAPRAKGFFERLMCRLDRARP